ncbi:MAG: ECF RNA polymerase sigma factor SigW [Pelotomaculum sp. PtaB.Bin104]|nr:MAG: ECF RNA polymerase sigma factor SigW [Pelotomaculum sp. PtaB.Bin104]
MTADEILVKKVQNCDLTAYGELVQRYQDRVYSLAVRMLNTPEDARDASQEIFIKVYKSLPGFDFRASFATWLYRVSANVCLDFLRRRGKEQKRSEPLRENRIRADCLADNSQGPEEALLEKESIRELRQAVDTLPDSYRIALVLHHYQELSYKQVAEVMDLPEKTVATRIHRAKMMLKEILLGGEGSELPENKKSIKQIPGRRITIL